MTKVYDWMLKHLALTAITIGCTFLYIWYRLTKKEVMHNGD